MSKLKGVASHHERKVAELGADRELALEYLKAATKALDNSNELAGGLLTLRTVAEAYGVLGAERRNDFDAEADARFANLLATGKTIPWSDARQYLEERVAGKQVPRPVAKKNRT